MFVIKRIVIKTNRRQKKQKNKNNSKASSRLYVDVVVSTENMWWEFYFISVFILLTRRKAMEALIHRVGNYSDLLPEMPRYCCPLLIQYKLIVIYNCLPRPLSGRKVP